MRRILLSINDDIALDKLNNQATSWISKRNGNHKKLSSKFQLMDSHLFVLRATSSSDLNFNIIKWENLRGHANLRYQKETDGISSRVVN